MKMLFGGRMAEEIVFGRVTTGAADDLRRVSEISRSMVEEYGMGSQLISRDDVHTSALLSEATRAKRDAEQQSLIDEAQWEARCLIIGQPQAARPARGVPPPERGARPRRDRPDHGRRGSAARSSQPTAPSPPPAAKT